MINRLKYIFLIIAIISFSILGVLIFGSLSPDPVFIKVFGAVCFIGIFGNAACIIRLNNLK